MVQNVVSLPEVDVILSTTQLTSIRKRKIEGQKEPLVSHGREEDNGLKGSLVNLELNATGSSSAPTFIVLWIFPNTMKGMASEPQRGEEKHKPIKVIGIANEYDSMASEDDSQKQLSSN